jgi:hypothetical protein
VLLLPGSNNVLVAQCERATRTRRAFAIILLLRQIVALMFLRNRAFAYNFSGSMPHLELVARCLTSYRRYDYSTGQLNAFNKRV